MFGVLDQCDIQTKSSTHKHTLILKLKGGKRGEVRKGEREGEREGERKRERDETHKFPI